MGQHLMSRPPKYVQGFIDRHGKPRFYFRRAGFKPAPLPGLPWSPGFMAAYEAASEVGPREIGASRTKVGAVNDAIVRYFAAGFGNWFRDMCAEAGLPIGISAHGLRKAAATRFANHGATAHELM